MTEDIEKKVRRRMGQWIGRAAEGASKAASAALMGYEVRETGVGSDYKRRPIPFPLLSTKRQRRWEYVEVKTGSAQLTPRQRKTRAAIRRKKGKYTVERRSFL